MPWIILIVAGLLEVAWASVLPATEGLSKPVPTACFVGLLAASMIALAKATESIPLGTAYGVWVGIGAVGAAAVGIALHGDPATPARVMFLVLLIVAIVGLKATGTTMPVS
jgi:quaternary ammonium compound-resistance protein SugE